MAFLKRALLFLLPLAASVQSSPLYIQEPLVEPPKKLPQKAPADVLKYQPILDYDTDSCYNVAAIDDKGYVHEGLAASWTTMTGGCRRRADLDNQNVYARRRCNSGWCAYMYDYYFAKDCRSEFIAPGAGGHRHEWENIVIWVKDGDDKPTWVSGSSHGGYNIKSADEVLFDGTNAKMVYHKDGHTTHCFRHATAEDDAQLENDSWDWVRAEVVDYDTGYAKVEIRDKLINAFRGELSPKTQDAKFADWLHRSIEDRIVDFDFATGS